MRKTMSLFKRPGAVPAKTEEPDLHPDKIDALLADLEEQVGKLPADSPATQDLRQEIETFRAMVESLHANHGWSHENFRSMRRTVQEIAERLKGRL
jgi:hypothetical protein